MLQVPYPKFYQNLTKDSKVHINILSFPCEKWPLK